MIVSDDDEVPWLPIVGRWSSHGCPQKLFDLDIRYRLSSVLPDAAASSYEVNQKYRGWHDTSLTKRCCPPTGADNQDGEWLEYIILRIWCRAKRQQAVTPISSLAEW
jgi:hypothetical protein